MTLKISFKAGLIHVSFTLNTQSKQKNKHNFKFHDQRQGLLKDMFSKRKSLHRHQYSWMIRQITLSVYKITGHIFIAASDERKRCYIAAAPSSGNRLNTAIMWLGEFSINLSEFIRTQVLCSYRTVLLVSSSTLHIDNISIQDRARRVNVSVGLQRWGGRTGQNGCDLLKILKR